MKNLILFLFICFCLVLVHLHSVKYNTDLKREDPIKHTIEYTNTGYALAVELYKQELALGKRKQEYFSGSTGLINLYLSGLLLDEKIKKIDSDILEKRTERLILEREQHPYIDGARFVYSQTVSGSVFISELGQEQVEKKDSKVEVPSKVQIGHKGFSDEYHLSMIRYAYATGGIDFVKMIECENGGWNHLLWSKYEASYGLCQISKIHHPNIINDKRIYNWKWQIDQCVILWKGGTKFYGPNRVSKNTNFMRCSNYVDDRFYFF